MKPIFKIVHQQHNGKYLIVRKDRPNEFTYYPVYQNGKKLEFYRENLAVIALNDIVKLYAADNVVDLAVYRKNKSTAFA